MNAHKSIWKLVPVFCPFCGWEGKRREPESSWWRDRQTPTCRKCGSHPVQYRKKPEGFVPHFDRELNTP